MEIIKVSDRVLATINNFSAQKENIKKELSVYASGLKEGLQVPSTWKLDLKNKALIPPESELTNESVALPQKAVLVIENTYKQLEKVDSMLQSYKVGLLHGLGLPENSVIDVKDGTVSKQESE